MLYKLNDSLYIRLEHVSAVKFFWGDGNAQIRADGMGWSCTPEEAEKLLQEINVAAATSPAADVPVLPDPVPFEKSNRIISIERSEFFSKTAGKYCRMWKCDTEEGKHFNIFEHVDPLRNNYALFDDSEWGELLDRMEMSDTLYFWESNVRVDLEQDGNFWKPVRVSSGYGIVADQPEDDSSDDLYDANDNPKPLADAIQTMTSARITGTRFRGGIMEIRFEGDEPETDDLPDENADRRDDDPFYSVIRSGNFVVLDTETTGLDEQAEICQVAIIDSAGKVLLDCLVKPVKPIPSQATAVHHITNAMVKDAPNFINVAQAIWDACQGKTVIVYNAEYDFRLLAQSEYACEPIAVSDWHTIKRECAMLKFAKLYGEWSEYRGDWKWQTLTTAARHYMLPVENAHSALGDCKMTLALVKAMLAAKNAK